MFIKTGSNRVASQHRSTAALWLTWIKGSKGITFVGPVRAFKMDESSVDSLTFRSICNQMNPTNHISLTQRLRWPVHTKPNLTSNTSACSDFPHVNKYLQIMGVYKFPFCVIEKLFFLAPSSIFGVWINQFSNKSAWPITIRYLCHGPHGNCSCCRTRRRQQPPLIIDASIMVVAG